MLFKPRYHLPDFFRSDIKFISLSKSVAFETNFWWFLAKSPSYTFHSCSYQHNIFFLKSRITKHLSSLTLRRRFVYSKLTSIQGPLPGQSEWPSPLHPCKNALNVHIIEITVNLRWFYSSHWKEKRPIICPNKPQNEIILLKLERAKRGRRKKRKFLPSLPQLINKY